MNIIEHFLPEECYTFSRSGLKITLQPSGTVIHYISGSGKWPAFPDDPYNIDRIVNEILIKYRVSYNYLISRDGSTYQLLPEGMGAFHAGKSRMNGRDSCNRFCFGVSLVSTGKGSEADPACPPKQIDSAVELHKELMRKYNFDQNNIKGHDHVREAWNLSYPKKPGKKKFDPGTQFPWDTFYSLLND